MNITKEQVRDALRKDDFDYINDQIERLMNAAKSSLLVAIGYKDGTPIHKDTAAEFEELTNCYIVEYVRAGLDLVDNEKMLTALATQCEALIREAEAEEEGGQ